MPTAKKTSKRSRAQHDRQVARIRLVALGVLLELVEAGLLQVDRRALLERMAEGP